MAVARFLERVRIDPVFISIKSFLRLFDDEAIKPALAGHLQVRAQLNKPATRKLNASRQITLRYLNPYLAKRFGKVARRQILLSHYRFLERTASQDFHDNLLHAPLTVWQATRGEDRFAIDLSINPRYEGELSLSFTVNGISVYDLSLTIAPGEHVSSGHRHVVLIGRLQGGRRYDLMKLAARACRHISPKYLLFVAAESFALALGIQAIAGVSSNNQVSKGDDPFFTFDYNEYWETLYGVRNETGFYEVHLPTFKKPLKDVPSGHRRNTKLKRAFKNEVGMAVRDVVFKHVIDRSPGPWPAHGADGAELPT